MKTLLLVSVLVYFILIQTVSAACPQNCKTCNLSDECQECNENFFLESATSCKPCSEISTECVKCSSKSKVCEQCQNKFLNKIDGTCVESCPSLISFAVGSKTEVRKKID